MPRFKFSGACFLAAACAVANSAAARDGCCSQCGGQAPCRKVCRLVREEKKVEIVCWGCKCEPFCIPGPSKPCGEHCETVCAECDQNSDGTPPQAKARRFFWTDWLPSYATVQVRKKLMKKTVAKTVPSYKWVVEVLCAECQSAPKTAAVEPGAVIPPPPRGYEPWPGQVVLTATAPAP